MAGSADESLEADGRARILVLDDAPATSQTVAEFLARTGDLCCVGVESVRSEWLATVRRHLPDAVVLCADPGRPLGLDALRHVAALRPLLGVSVDTPDGAERVVESLRLGARDFVLCPVRPNHRDFIFQDALYEKLRSLLKSASVQLGAMATADRRLKAASARAVAALGRSEEAEQQLRKANECIVVVAAGAGGPQALLQWFPQLRTPLPPVMVAVQPLPVHFVPALAQELDRTSALRCKVAEDGDVLQANWAYLTPPDRRSVVVREAGRSILRLHAAGCQADGARPRLADPLMQSTAIVYGSRCLGMLLTGQGRDGVEGARAIGVVGGFVLGQDAATCYDPSAIRLAQQLNYVDRAFHLEDAAEALNAVASYLGCPEISLARSPYREPDTLLGCPL